MAKLIQNHLAHSVQPSASLLSSVANDAQLASEHTALSLPPPCLCFPSWILYRHILEMCGLSWLRGPPQITSKGSQGGYEICRHSFWLNGDFFFSFFLMKSMGCPQAFLWANCNLFTLSTAVSYLLMKTCSVMAAPVKGLCQSVNMSGNVSFTLVSQRTFQDEGRTTQLQLWF